MAVYLEGRQLRPLHVDPEGVQVLGAGVGQNAAAPQGHGWLAQFVLALVLVEPQLSVLYEAPAGPPLAVHQHVEVAWQRKEETRRRAVMMQVICVC